MILLEFLAMDLVAFMFLFILTTTRSRTSRATLPAFQARRLTVIIPPTGYSGLVNEYLIYPLCARKGKATLQ